MAVIAVGDAMPDAEDDAMPVAEADAVLEAVAVGGGDDRIALLEAEVRSLQRKLSLWRGQIQKLPYWKRRAIAAEKSKAQFKRGRSQRYFSTAGAIDLSLRRLVGNVSTRRVGLCLKMDVSKTTVRKHEFPFRGVFFASAQP